MSRCKTLLGLADPFLDEGQRAPGNLQISQYISHTGQLTKRDRQESFWESIPDAKTPLAQSPVGFYGYAVGSIRAVF
jgi:hypothetical protein